MIPTSLAPHPGRPFTWYPPWARQDTPLTFMFGSWASYCGALFGAPSQNNSLGLSPVPRCHCDSPPVSLTNINAAPLRLTASSVAFSTSCCVSNSSSFHACKSGRDPIDHSGDIWAFRPTYSWRRWEISIERKCSLASLGISAVHADQHVIWHFILCVLMCVQSNVRKWSMHRDNLKLKQ